jgi:ABC-type nitrate/sulfonate/bicarbonate transport system substrate-binding protein
MPSVLPRRMWRALLGAAAITLIAGACSAPGTAGNAEAVAGPTVPDGQVTTLKYTNIVNVLNFPELAAKLGYLGNIQLERVGTYANPTQSVQDTSTGAVSFGAANNGTILQTVAKGTAIKATIGYVGFSPENAGGIYVAKDSPITDARGLVGSTVNGLNGLPAIIMQSYLTENGVAPSDVTAVDLPYTNGLEAALVKGDISASYLNGVLQSTALANGSVRELTSDYALFPDATYASYFFTDEFIAANPDTVKVFTEGVAKAIRWSIDTPHDQVLATYAEYLADNGRAAEVEPFKASWKTQGLEANKGRLQDSDFTIFLDFYLRTGLLTSGAVQVADAYTGTYYPTS